MPFAAKQERNGHIYEYRTADALLLYSKIRTDYSDGSKKFLFRKPDGAYGIKGVQRVPYNLSAVMKSETVYLVEGEKCADAVNKAGRVATTLDSGANSKWLPEYAQYFEGRKVIIIPDSDAPGEKYAQRLAKNIPESRIVRLPGLAEKEDVYDWLKSGHTMEELERLLEKPQVMSEEETEQRASPAKILIELFEQMDTTLFHSDTKDIYAAVPVDAHKEVLSLESKSFRLWLNGVYYNAIRKPLSNEAVNQALAILSAKALFDNPVPISLAVRIAEQEGSIWYDLSNEAWQTLKVTADGWKVVDNSPLIFKRYRHQIAQVQPQPGGNVWKVLDYINIKESKVLFLCWLISCFIPNIPHAAIILFGEKGAAKTTACSLLKLLVDPSVFETIVLEKDTRTLAVNLQDHLFLPFDNVSHISSETSDMLCRAVTGGGIQQRKMYSNGEDYIFRFMRCICINGISCVATRPDLLDRSILIELERISEADRRELSEVMESFKNDRASILGGIFDTLSKAMAIYPTLKLDRLPRMADFARWGYAIAEAMGKGLGQTFLKEYDANRQVQNREALNSDAVATLIIVLLNVRTEWYGRMSDLHNELMKLAPNHGISTKALPSKANNLSRWLKGIRSNLEAVGITYEISYKSDGTYIFLKMWNSSPAAPYKQESSVINGLQNGDALAVAGGGNASSPYVSPLQIVGLIGSGGNGGNSPDF